MTVPKKSSAISGGSSVPTSSKLHPRYVTDSHGCKTAVILPIEEYEGLLADLADLAVIAERRNEPAVPHDRTVAELTEGRHLSD